MPSDEPNSKMDDLLRAYAKKRRGQGDAPGEIHPATRRLLQDEVRRTFGTGNNAASAGGSNWRKWRWPLVAMWGGGVALLVAFAMLNAQLDRLAPAKESSQHSVAKSLPDAAKKRMPLLAGRGGESNRNLGLPDEKSSLAANRGGHSPLAAQMDKSPQSIPPAPVAAAAPPPADSFASSDVPAVLKDSASPAATPVGRPTGGATPPGAATPLASGATAPSLSESSPGAGRSSFQNNLAKPPSATFGATFDSGAQSFVRAKKDPANEPAPEVLSNFRMSRAGQNVSIVDQDGSVYNGKVSDDAPIVEGARSLATRAARVAPASTNGNWNFNVSGTNRSLQQSVTFSGNVQSLGTDFSNVALGRAQALSSGGVGAVQARRARARPAAAPTTNAASISGTVQIGQGQQFKIEAQQPSRSP